MDTLGVFDVEDVAVEEDEVSCCLSLEGVNLLVDGIGIESVLQHGESRLRIACPVEGLGIAQVDHVGAIECHAGGVELVDGLHLVGHTGEALLAEHAVLVEGAKAEVAGILGSGEIVLRGVDGVDGLVYVGIGGTIVGRGRELAQALGRLYLCKLLVDIGGCLIN